MAMPFSAVSCQVSTSSVVEKFSVINAKLHSIFSCGFQRVICRSQNKQQFQVDPGVLNKIKEKKHKIKKITMDETGQLKVQVVS